MFSADCGNGAVFRHIDEMLSGSCGRCVIFVTLWKRCEIIEISLFPYSHGRNIPLVLQEKCYHGHMAEMFPLCCRRNVICATWQKCAPFLQRKCYLDQIAEALSSRYIRNVIFATWHEYFRRVAKEMLFLPHRRDVIYELQKSKCIMYIADTDQRCRSKSKVLQLCLCRMKK